MIKMVNRGEPCRTTQNHIKPHLTTLNHTEPYGTTRFTRVKCGKVVREMFYNISTLLFELVLLNVPKCLVLTFKQFEPPSFKIRKF